MVEMLNKLEFMLMGLRQMNLNAVCAWFTNLKREDIIKAIEESPKFKLEGNIVSLKSETELYEEELQKDILKDLMGDMEDGEEDDEFSDYDDDDLEIVEELGETPKVLEDKKVEEDLVLPNNNEDKSSDEEVTENSDDLDEDSIVDSLWVEAKEPANIPEVESLEENEEENNEEPIQEEQEVVQQETVPEEIIETSSDEDAPVESKEYFEYYYNKDSDEEEEKVENSESGKVENEMVDNNVTEKVVEKVVQVKDTSKINGSEVSYEELIRIIEEYNENIEDKINYATEHSFEVKVKAIRSFYENKYNVRIKENNIADTDACIFALIHKKKGMEVAYLVVCEVLTDEILNYMLDNYDEEVVYFCPVDGTETDFEVGLNEFYLKDTQVIFDKFLEHYVVIEECDLKVKKLQVIVGSK